MNYNTAKVSVRFTEMAKELSRTLFDRHLDIPVYLFNDVESKSYGFYRYQYRRTRKTRQVIGYKPIGIYLNAIKMSYNEDKMIDVLKHELCHWACQQSGKPFKDGSKNFESELLRIGASSTRTDFDSERSTAYQQQVKNGELNRLGRADFTYVKKRNHYMQTYYDVYHDGAYIGKVINCNSGTFKWKPESVTGKYHENTYWRTRKACVEQLYADYTS